MGWGLGADDEVGFVHGSEQCVAEVDVPEAVIDLLETDVVLLERVGDEDEAVLETEGGLAGGASGVGVRSSRVAR